MAWQDAPIEGISRSARVLVSCTLMAAHALDLFCVYPSCHSQPTLVLKATAELQHTGALLQPTSAIEILHVNTACDASGIHAVMNVCFCLQTRTSVKALPFWWSQAQDLAILAGSFKCGMWPSSARAMTEAMFRDPDSILYRVMVSHSCFPRSSGAT